MSNLQYRSCYQRNLPHIQPEGAELFSTFRLVDSLPKPLIDRWREEKKRLLDAIRRSGNPTERARREAALQRVWFARMDRYLDRAQTGPKWLGRPDVARLVADALHYLNGKKYDLVAYSILPNHVHAVFIPLFKRPVIRSSPRPGSSGGGQAYHSLASIMHSLKGYTANRCNRLLGRAGQFWEHESYDHNIRDEAEESRIIEYVLGNPVRAGLAKTWEEWPWSFWRGAM